MSNTFVTVLFICVNVG